MKTLRLAAVAILAALTSFCSAGAPAYAAPAEVQTPPPPPPPRLTPAEIAKLLPEPKAPDEPSEWYGPFDLRTASIA